MPSLISSKIDIQSVESFCNFLQNIPNIEVQKPKNYEAFRGRYNGSSLIVYLKGSITYLPDHGIEQLNEEYYTSKNSYKAPQNQGSSKLTVKLTIPQLNELILILDQINGISNFKTASLAELRIYKYKNEYLTLYKSGSIYSPNGLEVYKNLVVDAVKKHPTHPNIDIIIGQDEVGNGEIFGPLVFGSVAL